MRYLTLQLVTLLEVFRYKEWFFGLLFLLFWSCHPQKKQEATTARSPNIIYILTDDLGYGDVGVFFQNQRKIKGDRSEPWVLTPNLDQMASEGAMLTHHYAAAPVCAPSRASFLLGVSQGHANVRNGQFDKALADNHTVANVLQKAGYKTVAIGKWGLQGSSRWSENGDSWPAHPLNRGFDYYYGYVRHIDGHEHYPKEAVYRGPSKVYDNRKEVSQDLDKCYSGDLWTARAKKWIVEQATGQNAAQPFFMYLALDTPHAVTELPTQAYPKGGGLSGGLQWIGEPGKMINTASGEVDSWIHPDYENATYDDDENPESAEVEWPNVYKRYATSTRRIDDQVGDILKLLADLDIDENTMVVFSSDNGPSLESYLAEDFEANFFNSFGPFDGVKRDVLEGGERVPLIARWPGQIPAGHIVASPNIAYDWLPTFAELAGMPAPVNSDGVSLVPSLTRKGEQQESLIYVEYRHGGKTPNYEEFSPGNRGKRRKEMQFLRLGNMVGVRYDIQNADDDFELYDVLKDAKQSNNLADHVDMVNIQKKMKQRVLQVRMPNNTAPRPYDDAPIPANEVGKLKKGLKLKIYDHETPWLSKAQSLKITEERVITSLEIGNFDKECLAVLEGYLLIEEEGSYTFYLSVPTKAFIRIHDANLLDEDYGYQKGTVVEQSVNLAVGHHPIKIYYQCAPKGEHAINLQWTGPSFPKSAIPASSFFLGE